MLAFGTQDRGFKPGRSRRIFQGEKILSKASFGREVKPFVPCRRFKDQGLYNKPSTAVQPGALAAGTLPQYNIFVYWFKIFGNIFFVDISLRMAKSLALTCTCNSLTVFVT